MQPRVMLAVLLLALTGGHAARAEVQYEPYEVYQGRFYQRLGASCIQRAGPAPSCFELLEASLEFNPNAPIIHFTLGKYYAALGELNRATGAFSRALELDSTLTVALIALGDVYLMRGERDQALVYYKRFVAQAPLDPMGPYSLGAAAAEGLDERQALTYLKQAIGLGFSDAAALRQDGRWRNVVGSEELEALLATLPPPQNAAPAQ